MIEVDLRIFFSALMAVGLFLLFLIWTYLESRTSIYQQVANKGACQCTRCGKLYDAPRTGGKHACPRCGFENIHLSI